MITYRQFLSESTNAIKYVVNGPSITISGILGSEPFHLSNGNTYFLDSKGLFHNDSGPAVIIGVRSDRSVYCKHGQLHREDGPAIELKNRHDQDGWWLFNHRISPPVKTSPASDEEKWILLKGSMLNNLGVLNRIGMNKDQQEYICQHRPDLICKIDGLDPELVNKYQHEQELGQTDL